MRARLALDQRLQRKQAPTYQHLQALQQRSAETPPAPVHSIDCGWGRLLLGHTYPDEAGLAAALLEERPGERDIALYVATPQRVLAQAPQQLFLDPSDTLRLWFSDYRPARRAFRGFAIRRVQGAADWAAVNRLYRSRAMQGVDPQRLTAYEDGGPVYWLAEDSAGRLVGAVMGLDHWRAFADPEGGASLWCLAVADDAGGGGVGEALVRHLIEHYQSRGRSHLDLSVLHDNRRAQRLYRRLGFRPLATFAVKRRNRINQALYLGPELPDELNPYARIITDEALRRGIEVEVLDAPGGLFALTLGSRRIRCRESLSDLTSAPSLLLCQDKRLTRACLAAAGLAVPEQQLAGLPTDNAAFLARHRRVVVKPVNGEQGQGVAVDLREAADLETAIVRAQRFDARVLLESFHPGLDLRVVVIGYAVVAAAIRHPARVTGDGHSTLRQLIESASACRAAATDGESRIPLDGETRRTLAEAGLDLDSVLPAGQCLNVRRTANLHTGGTLEDVTERLHPALAEAAVRAAQALEIPVVGLDLLVADPARPDYVIIEANERVGLANHAPQPTAERFLDLLFPLSRQP